MRNRLSVDDEYKPNYVFPFPRPYLISMKKGLFQREAHTSKSTLQMGSTAFNIHNSDVGCAKWIQSHSG